METAVEFDDDIALAGSDHWTGRYVGMPYRPGAFDCAHLVECVMLEQFGRAVRLPQHRVSEKSRDLSGQIAAAAPEYLVRHDGPPVEGNCALMIGAGRANHIGVVALIAAEVWVLHNFIAARAVRLHRARDLHRYGLAVEGYYAWK